MHLIDPSCIIWWRAPARGPMPAAGEPGQRGTGALTPGGRLRRRLVMGQSPTGAACPLESWRSLIPLRSPQNRLRSTENLVDAESVDVVVCGVAEVPEPLWQCPAAALPSEFAGPHGVDPAKDCLVGLWNER